MDHIVEIWADDKLIKKLEFCSDSFHNHISIKIPSRLSDIKVKFSNNYTWDLWEDFKIKKDYAPYPHNHEEFIHFSKEFDNFTLKLVTEYDIEQDKFTIETIAFDKVIICKCGEVAPDSCFFDGDELIGCSSCDYGRQ